MAVSFSARLYGGFAAAIAIVAISGITSYSILRKEENIRPIVRSARQLVDCTAKIRLILIEMETGQRGYRVTGDKRFLEPYDSAAAHLPGILITFDTVGMANESINLGRQNLKQDISDITVFWTALATPTTYNKAALDSITTIEKQKMDAIRSNIASLAAEETLILNKTREDYDKTVKSATISSVLDSLLSEVVIILLIILIIREFKKRKAAQQELLVANQQLAERSEQVARINTQLQKFTYTVAHDIKSPLSGIAATFTYLSDEQEIVNNPALSEFVNLGIKAAEQLTDKVDNILDASKKSIIDIRNDTVDTGELARQITVLLFPPKWIEVHVAHDMPVLETPRIKIEQVFHNLISNAIKYNGKGKGTIDISVTEKGDFYQFSVKDTGVGIDEEYKDRVFELSTITNNRSTADSSTGFGLAIAKQIVEEQGGRIWFESVKDRGTTFYFEWPKRPRN
jgi:signal transduction histidine kinase